MSVFYSIWFKLILVLVLIAGAVYFANWWSGARYDKKQAEHEAEKAKWATERAGYEARIAERDRAMAERDIRIQALEAAAEARKKVDDDLAKKIEEEAKKIAEAEKNAQIPTSCILRAERICALFRATDKRFDCTVLFGECSE